jgi:putative two-component system response regulator
VVVANDVIEDCLLQREVVSNGDPLASLESADSVMMKVAMRVEARDPGTAEHCRRLSKYATAVGRKIGLGGADLVTLRHGGYLHDIGKIAIPGAVLQKRGPLSRDERTLVEQHALIGDRFCAALPSLRHVRPIVRHHHERMDGSGYPDKLRGDEIPLLARIVGIVDVFDALMTVRPYKAAMPFDRAAEVLRLEAARGWHCADLVSTFLNMVAMNSVVMNHRPSGPLVGEIGDRFCHRAALTVCPRVGRPTVVRHEIGSSSNERRLSTNTARCEAACATGFQGGPE